MWLAGFSILFGSMFLEIISDALMEQFSSAFQYPLWIDVFGNRADYTWWVFPDFMFQYPLWIDVFGNEVVSDVFQFRKSGFSILFGSMFLEITCCG